MHEGRLQLSVTLLGGFRVVLGNRPIADFRSDRVRALLAYLALESAGRPVRRERLASLLWPGYLRESALQSLRTALFDLRRLLGQTSLLEISRRDVCLHTSSPDFWCDALEVERLWAAVERDADQGPILRRRLDELAALLSVEFLEGFNLPDAPEFTAWKHSRREKFARIARQVGLLRTPAVIPLYNLPRPITPFFGREQELAILREKLLASDYPLITLSGPGGVGKTRLALAAAERVWHAFPDGVWFVPVANPDTTAVLQPGRHRFTSAFDHLAAQIADALHLAARGRLSLTQHLLAYLQTRTLLLILDGYDLQSFGCDPLMRLIEQAPYVRLLVTARQRLGLQMEYVFRVDGLPVPPRNRITGRGADASTDPDALSSVQLFVERARRTTVGFELTPANVDDVVAICQTVEGLPLAIELAAALTDRYSCAEILQAIERDLDALTEPSLDRPPRQRSMRAVFEQSWSLLSPEEMRVLIACAVYRGGFTAEAFAAVAQARPDMLKRLLDISHLRRDGTGRYHMHDLLRQFVAEKGEERRLLTRFRELHARYYLQLFDCSEPLYWHTVPAATMRNIGRELSNIQVAWHWAVQAHDLALLDQTVNGLSLFLDHMGLLALAATWLSAACQKLTTDKMASFAHADVLQSNLRAWLAHFLTQIGQYEVAVAEGKRALEAAQHSQDAKAIAFALLKLGEAWFAQVSSRRAQVSWQEGLRRTNTITMTSLHNELLCQLGRVALRRGEMEDARRYLTKAHELAHTTADPIYKAIAQINLGVLAMDVGDYADALMYLAAAELRNLIAHHEPLAAELDNRLILLYLLLGNYDAVPALQQRLSEAAVRLGQHELHIFSLINRIRLNYVMGDYPAALAAVEAALPLCRTYGSSYPAAVIQTQAGHAYQALRAWGKAEAIYHAALRAWQHRENLPRKAGYLVAMAGLAEVALARGDLALARAIAEEAAAQLGRPFVFQPTHTEPLRIYLACYRVWQAVGDLRAAELLAATAAILQQQAAGIPDPMLRRTFLENVAVNREIARLAGLAPASPVE